MEGVTMAIPFIDLQRQYRENQEAIDRQIREVLDTSEYILSAKVAEIEAKLAAFAGVKHAIGVGNGTDALQIPLLAIGLQPGDEVITTPFTFIATAEVVALRDGLPVFVDIEPGTYNIDPGKIEERITPRTRAIMTVDLFGQCADYDRIHQIADRHGLFVMEDAAQSFGAQQKGRRAGSLGDMAGTSFYPPKPLGCYGEGGMIFTDCDESAEVIRSLRVHGQGEKRYENVHIGMNARLDAIQAAVLLGKLPTFEWEMQQRQQVAQRYTEGLKDVVTTPTVRADNVSAWAQYSIRVPDRQTLRASLAAADIPTAVFYPIPVHLQRAFSYLGYEVGSMPVAEEVARDIVSLPMHPYLAEETQDRIIEEVRHAVGR